MRMLIPLVHLLCGMEGFSGNGSMGAIRAGVFIRLKHHFGSVLAVVYF